MSANCLVFAGAPLHASAGDTFLPSAVWSIGTTSLAFSVGLVTTIVAGVCAHAGNAMVETRTAKNIGRKRIDPPSAFAKAPARPRGLSKAAWNYTVCVHGPTQPPDAQAHRNRVDGGTRDRIHPGPVEAEARGMADLRRRSCEHALLAARSDQRKQLQQAAARLPVQDREPRPAAGVPVSEHAADGQRPAIHHRRHAASGGRT